MTKNDLTVIYYTCVSGDYDALREQPVPITRLIAGESDDSVRASRERKWQPERFLPPHDISVWIDGNISLVAELDVVALFDNDDLVTFRHPIRNCVWDEARTCIELVKDDQFTIVKQMLTLNPPRGEGVSDTGMLIRRNTSKVNAVCDAVWRTICEGSRRDQLCFDYHAKNNGLSYNRNLGNRHTSGFVSVHLHSNYRRVTSWST